MKEQEFKKLMKATLGDLLLYGEEECDKHFDSIMENNKKILNESINNKRREVPNKRKK
tara:strand:+ start:462 stop:635 length:174 start_codon:yes stop_codon:yes gene_type:complete